MDNDNSGRETEMVVPFDPSTAADIRAASGHDSAAREPQHPEVFDELLGRWEEKYRLGQEPALESLCGIDSPLLEPLRERIGKLKKLYAVLGLSPAAMADNDPAGEPTPTIPGYEVLGEIGRGGMGVVYKARDLKLGRIVAIKTIAEAPIRRPRPARAVPGRGPGRRPAAAPEHHRDPRDRRARRAALLLARIRRGGQPCPNGWPRGPWPREAAELVETLARAVHAAHQAGDHPPRPQAQQRPLDGRRRPQDQRLRPGQAPGRRLGADASRARSWARPATWPPSRPRDTRTGRPGRRCLRARDDPLPGVDRPAAVPGRVGAGDAQLVTRPRSCPRDSRDPTCRATWRRSA